MRYGDPSDAGLDHWPQERPFYEIRGPGLGHQNSVTFSKQFDFLLHTEVVPIRHLGLKRSELPPKKCKNQDTTCGSGENRNEMTVKWWQQ